MTILGNSHTFADLEADIAPVYESSQQTSRKTDSTQDAMGIPIVFTGCGGYEDMAAVLLGHLWSRKNVGSVNSDTPKFRTWELAAL
jgi:hypothetical protein